MQEELRIGSQLSYVSQLENGNESLRQSCVAQYKEQLASAQQLSKKYPIFLDTNVLLGYYQMPYFARLKMYQFLEKNKERIYICDQVKKEFERHQKKVHQDYLANIRIEKPTPLQKEVRTYIDDYIYENQDVLNAYPEFQKELQGVYENSAQVLQKIATFAEWKTARAKEILSEQDIQNLLPQLQQLPRLSNKEYSFIKAEFETLKKRVEQFNGKGRDAAIEEYLYRHPDKVFPGIGDIKNKPGMPYGDYLIYHEMMKWQAQQASEQPFIFLTNDVTKSDWVDNSKRPYIHYLENMQLNCGTIFYILHAEETFTEQLEVDCANLVTELAILDDVEEALAFAEQQKESDLISVASIQALVEELYPNRAVVEEAIYWEDLVEELEEVWELKSMYLLKNKLLDYYHLLLQVEIEHFEINDQMGAIDLSLEFDQE